MGAAQGGIVDDIYGNWNAVVFQDCGAVGRIPVVVPVTWKEDTPVFGIDAKVPMKLSLPSMKPDYKYKPLYGSDDFKGGLKDFWQFSHEPDLSLVSVDKKAGALRISTDKTAVNIHQARNVLTQRMISPGCAGEITVDASNLKEGDYAGITVYQGNYIWIGVTRRNGKLCAVTTTFTSEEDTWITAKEPGREQCCMPIEDTTVRLRLEASFGPGRDEAFCSILDDSEWKEFGPKHKLSFRLDHFTGARFGLFIYSTKEMGGSAAFSDFTYEAF
jgi:beta-xylosidase